MVYKEPTYASIPLESANGLSNVRGSVAMARTSQPDSATSQFYVNLVNNSASLDAAGSQPPGYAVFGTVVASMALGTSVDTLPPVAGSSAAFDASETRCASTVKPWNRALTWAAVRVPV
jgi:cyclophilin family peptidyl-prolyl cis-trans isomerase